MIVFSLLLLTRAMVFTKLASLLLGAELMTSESNSEEVLTPNSAWRLKTPSVLLLLLTSARISLKLERLAVPLVLSSVPSLVSHSLAMLRSPLNVLLAN
jgi:hypothetical protein